MSSQRFPRLTPALYGTLILGGSVIAGVERLDVPDLQNTIAVLMEDGRPSALAALNAQPMSDKADSSAPGGGVP